ncbi:Xylanolytic transcriptional activator xlnR [Pleurostoma richardsiae]|uniref:Xylanolytic transcriptional activator xlnR n=1 Tax=Pleurostoma richardsiae TaxID=41990 RepID=A0AA38RRL8_9PEZI|nr:Xylanolytic transcriptional activator xlnR [Pleurostoma richardsiae]
MSSRACDSCRRRKIKCDSSSTPCSNCRISSLDCAYTVPPKKRGPKPTSVRRRRVQHAASSPVAETASQSPARALTDDPGLPSRGWHQLVGIEPDVTSPGFSCHSHGHSSETLSIGRHPMQPYGIGAWPNSSIPDVRDAAMMIYSQLVSVIHTAVPSRSIGQIVDDCINLYFQFIFPIGPICHEPTLRRDAARLFPDSPREGLPSPTAASPSAFSADHEPKSHLATIRAFTLLTSLCADTAMIMPDRLLRLPNVVASSFLNASRGCLKLFEDYDIEHANSTSIVIRILQSAALHSSGRTGHSWHVLGQAILLAQELRLDHERSLARHASDPLEAQLLRSLFWVLHMSNRSAAVLNNRPILLRGSLFDPPPDVSFLAPDRIPLLDPTRPFNAPPFEDRLLAGADLCCRLWSSASDLIQGIQDCAHLQPDGPERGPTVAALMRSYVAFAGILDDLPHWLQVPDSVMSDDKVDAAAAAYQRGTFWRLRVDVVVTFHCLRMVLLRRCAEHGLVAVMGLSEEPLMLAMRTAEIARDCLDAVEAIPFEYLQANGEPLMEKFRQIGSALLELSQNTDYDMIENRAKAYLTRLLNILARLDSRAVDLLNGDQP